MSFTVDIKDAQAQFPDYTFIKPLTPSAQKCAFHVRDADDTDLCLKIISPTYGNDRLQREITAMQQISHENVVSLLEYTFSSTPGSLKHYVIEEFVEGDDLQAHLNTPWDRSRLSKVFSQLMDGLQQLNEKDIVHRDLKPTNIRLRSDDSPVIIDFGLARHLTMTDLTATAQGAQIGTPLYFAPEQFQGTKYDIDHRTDLFASGIIIYQALVARHPFYAAGMSRPDLQDRVCSNDDFKRDADFLALPKKWQLLLSKLLEKERSKRINSAQQAAMLLRKLENE
ncbi:MAG: serine/threonine-protein kinase [Planctomycetaceae bacterium]